MTIKRFWYICTLLLFAGQTIPIQAANPSLTALMQAGNVITINNDGGYVYVGSNNTLIQNPNASTTDPKAQFTVVSVNTDTSTFFLKSVATGLMVQSQPSTNASPYAIMMVGNNSGAWEQLNWGGASDPTQLTIYAGGISPNAYWTRSLGNGLSIGTAASGYTTPTYANGFTITLVTPAASATTATPAALLPASLPFQQGSTITISSGTQFLRPGGDGSWANGQWLSLKGTVPTDPTCQFIVKQLNSDGTFCLQSVSSGALVRSLVSVLSTDNAATTSNTDVWFTFDGQYIKGIYNLADTTDWGGYNNNARQNLVLPNQWQNGNFAYLSAAFAPSLRNQNATGCGPATIGSGASPFTITVVTPAPTATTTVTAQTSAATLLPAQLPFQQGSTITIQCPAQGSFTAQYLSVLPERPAITVGNQTTAWVSSQGGSDPTQPMNQFKVTNLQSNGVFSLQSLSTACPGTVRNMTGEMIVDSSNPTGADTQLMLENAGNGTYYIKGYYNLTESATQWFGQSGSANTNWLAIYGAGSTWPANTPAYWFRLSQNDIVNRVNASILNPVTTSSGATPFTITVVTPAPTATTTVAAPAAPTSSATLLPAQLPFQQGSTITIQCPAQGSFTAQYLSILPERPAITVGNQTTAWVSSQGGSDPTQPMNQFKVTNLQSNGVFSLQSLSTACPGTVRNMTGEMIVDSSNPTGADTQLMLENAGNGTYYIKGYYNLTESATQWFGQSGSANTNWLAIYGAGSTWPANTPAYWFRLSQNDIVNRVNASILNPVTTSSGATPFTITVVTPAPTATTTVTATVSTPVTTTALLPASLPFQQGSTITISSGAQILRPGGEGSWANGQWLSLKGTVPTDPTCQFIVKQLNSDGTFCLQASDGSLVRSLVSVLSTDKAATTSNSDVWFTFDGQYLKGVYNLADTTDWGGYNNNARQNLVLPNQWQNGNFAYLSAAFAPVLRNQNATGCGPATIGSGASPFTITVVTPTAPVVTTTTPVVTTTPVTTATKATTKTATKATKGRATRVTTTTGRSVRALPKRN